MSTNMSDSSVKTQRVTSLLQEIAKYPEDFSMGENVSPKKFTFYNNQIYGLGSNGAVYLWDYRVSIGFKEELPSTERFNDIAVGRGFMLLMRPYIKPDDCLLNCTSPDPVTFKPVEMALDLYDDSGRVCCDPKYPLRIGVLFSKSASSSKKINELAQDLKKRLAAQKPTQALPTFQLANLSEPGEFPVTDLKVDRTDNGRVYFTFVMRNAASFLVLVSINEKLVGGYAQVTVRDNPDGEPQPEQPEVTNSDDIMKEIREQELKEEREEKERRKKMLAEQKRLQEEEARRAEEELRLKTKARAEENLRAHMAEKKLKEQKESEAKKQKMDMRVGGGFDLDKYAALKKRNTERDSMKDLKETLLATPPPPIVEKPKREPESSAITRDPSSRDNQREIMLRQSEKMSQYEGIQMSEKDREEDEERSEVQSPDVNMTPGSRPGSGYRVREMVLKRGSRPGSRLQNTGEDGYDPRLNNFDISNVHASKDVLAELQMMASRLEGGDGKKMPIKVTMRTGENFFSSHPGKEMASPELLMSRDLTELKVTNREKLLSGRTTDNETSTSQAVDNLNTSQSMKRSSFKISTTSKPASRGLSQDKARAKLDLAAQAAAEDQDKTAPKKTKGGHSLQRKPDTTKMPLINPPGKASLSSLQQPTLKLKKPAK